MCGLGINVFLVIKTDLASLGVFNQIYAFYIIFSQFSAFAINDAIQQSIAAHSSNKKKVDFDKITGFCICLVSGTATAFVLFACAPFIGGIIDSSSVGLGLKWASAGILFFTLNKVLLACLNGQRKIKLYCIIQMLRSLLMFMCVVFIVLKNMPAYMLGIVFTFSEVAVLVPLVFLNFYPRLV